MIDLVKKVFVERKVPEFLNRTHIVLIPKFQGPETFGNYRPISLCNIVYKVIKKIIVARLRPFLEKLISPLQAAFVPGRKGIDNAIIVQEIVHTLSKKKGKVGYMAIKVDLEKAYNKLEWSFTRGMLIRANLPANLIELIMSCVSTVSTSILVNGEALDPIYPQKGLGKETHSPHTCLFCVWTSLANLSKKNVRQKCGSLLKLLKVGHPFRIYFLRMIWFYLGRQMGGVVLLLEMFWMNSVACRDNQ